MHKYYPKHKANKFLALQELKGLTEIIYKIKAIKSTCMYIFFFPYTSSNFTWYQLQ